MVHYAQSRSGCISSHAWPQTGQRLAFLEIIHRARINRYLSRNGALWQREYYDHLIRDGEQLQRAIRYTAHNPLKSGLKNWPYVYISAEAFGGPAATDVSSSTW